MVSCFYIIIRCVYTFLKPLDQIISATQLKFTVFFTRKILLKPIIAILATLSTSTLRTSVLKDPKSADQSNCTARRYTTSTSASFSFEASPPSSPTFLTISPPDTCAFRTRESFPLTSFNVSLDWKSCYIGFIVTNISCFVST